MIKMNFSIDKSLRADIAIIGGTGIYNTNIIENTKKIDVATPYGDCSDKITLGTYMNKKIAFLPRHGQKHSVAPHKINVRGNIWALKELGVTRIIAPCAVGSLRGYKDTFVPMLIMILSYWVIGLPLGYSLAVTDFWAISIGAPGMWSGMTLGLCIAASLTIWRLNVTSQNFLVDKT